MIKTSGHSCNLIPSNPISDSRRNIQVHGLAYKQQIITESFNSNPLECTSLSVLSNHEYQYSNVQLENKVKFCLEEIEILQINSLVNLS